jgi:DNA-binding beta-propeller fold protein YncE
MMLGGPRGIDVASDGTIYVVAAAAKRVAHFSAAGKLLGFVGPRFGDPYDVVVTPSGLYVVDTSAAGVIEHVAPSGSHSPVSGS